jgi:hypothetical protein
MKDEAIGSIYEMNQKYSFKIMGLNYGKNHKIRHKKSK